MNKKNWANTEWVFDFLQSDMGDNLEKNKFIIFRDAELAGVPGAGRSFWCTNRRLSVRQQ